MPSFPRIAHFGRRVTINLSLEERQVGAGFEIRVRASGTPMTTISLCY
jgi:hypothetical protein